MQNNIKSIFWNAVFVFVLLSLCGLVYLSGKRIDYNWNWERVVPYIATNAASAIAAPEDGNIVLTESNQLALENLSGEILIDLSGFESVQVYEGDLIFEGDTLATVEEWRIGPILEGVLVTIKISLWSLVIALVLGLIIGLMRISSNQIGRASCRERVCMFV